MLAASTHADKVDVAAHDDRREVGQAGPARCSASRSIRSPSATRTFLEATYERGEG